MNEVSFLCLTLSAIFIYGFRWIKNEILRRDRLAMAETFGQLRIAIVRRQFDDWINTEVYSTIFEDLDKELALKEIPCRVVVCTVPTTSQEFNIHQDEEVEIMKAFWGVDIKVGVWGAPLLCSVTLDDDYITHLYKSWQSRL